VIRLSLSREYALKQLMHAMLIHIPTTPVIRPFGLTMEFRAPSTTEKRRITYALNGDNKTKFMMLDQGSTIQTFLNLACWCPR
jgi:hypothetical protein